MGKRKTLDSEGNWKPRAVKIIYTQEKLTAGAGLGPLIDEFVKSPQFQSLKPCVPHRSGNASYDPIQFVLPLMAGFWHGYDCLEDMEKLETKPDMDYRFEGLRLDLRRKSGTHLRNSLFVSSGIKILRQERGPWINSFTICVAVKNPMDKPNPH